MANILLQRLRLHAQQHSEDIAIREISRVNQAHRSVTFSQLQAMIDSLATTLVATLQPGDIVIVSLPNNIACTVAFLATLRANMVGFLINPQVSDFELRRAILQSTAKAIIANADLSILDGLDIHSIVIDEAINHGFHSTIDSTNDMDSSGCGLMLLSSGTTETPKIIYRDGASLDAVAKNIATATNLSFTDRILGMVPLCHSYGVEHGILAPTYAGACVHLCQGFDAQCVLDQLQTGAITVWPGVPSIFEQLAKIENRSYAFPNLRCAYSAGSHLPKNVTDACRQNLQLTVGQLYGSSEVGSITFNDPNQVDHDSQSVGLPMTNVSIRIVDPDNPQFDDPLPCGHEGEVAISAPSMLTYYFNQKVSPLHDGYFLTGDLGVVDKTGALTITGRLKLLIDVGALKVNPLEVEAQLCEHPQVKECAVLALSITETISRIKAFIVPIDVDNPPSIEELRLFSRERLSAHKIPRVYDIVTSLPKSPTGKLLRMQLA